MSGSQPAEPARAAPTPRQLFVAFNEIALSGFGGTLPWSYRTLVERRRWLTEKEYLETLALGQLLPGPNICNVATMVGYRYAGYRGAAAALGGLVLGPFLLMLLAGILYARYGSLPVAQQALNGMAAVAGGLVLGTGVRMTKGMAPHWRAWTFGTLAFVGVGLLRLPLIAVLAVLAPLAVAGAWKR